MRERAQHEERLFPLLSAAVLSLRTDEAALREDKLPRGVQKERKHKDAVVPPSWRGQKTAGERPGRGQCAWALRCKTDPIAP